MHLLKKTAFIKKILLFTRWSDAGQEDFLGGVVGHPDDERVAVDDLEDRGGELLVLGGDHRCGVGVVGPDA